MKLRLWVLLLVSVCPLAHAMDSESARRTSVDENGKRIGWHVSDEQFRKTPEWKFDGKSSPPLAMPVAYQRALVWIRKTFPNIAAFELTSYGLSAMGNPAVPNRWYYTFDFLGEKNGSVVHNSRMSVMVLMDGTVVEPRPLQ